MVQAVRAAIERGKPAMPLFDKVRLPREPEALPLMLGENAQLVVSASAGSASVCGWSDDGADGAQPVRGPQPTPLLLRVAR